MAWRLLILVRRLSHHKPHVRQDFEAREALLKSELGGAIEPVGLSGFPGRVAVTRKAHAVYVLSEILYVESPSKALRRVLRCARREHRRDGGEHQQSIHVLPPAP